MNKFRNFKLHNNNLPSKWQHQNVSLIWEWLGVEKTDTKQTLKKLKKKMFFEYCYVSGCMVIQGTVILLQLKLSLSVHDNNVLKL